MTPSPILRSKDSHPHQLRRDNTPNGNNYFVPGSASGANVTHYSENYDKNNFPPSNHKHERNQDAWWMSDSAATIPSASASAAHEHNVNALG
eukprot:CAMPEP_0172510656 /NCGR_PEP_ID=MMETSP1066-20121228/230431_1 /TAXON_ID=671091 /ORGANISM="Coscinodiscus wailesii, Strain CCMP2513" /LENGTH=91 /DNA_ID=CAMNT_0013289733 /DNA_START=15 /DNA_END=288 /DNA_ORIENTATION=-